MKKFISNLIARKKEVNIYSVQPQFSLITGNGFQARVKFFLTDVIFYVLRA